MKQIRYILGILLALLIVILVVENHEAMSTQVVFKADFFLFKTESLTTNVYFVVIITFLFGVLLSGLYGIIERFRLKKQIKILERAARERDKELNSLRNLPITSDDVCAGQSDSVREAD